MGKDSAAWMVVGGRKRLGRSLAEGLAAEGPLVLTSSEPWEGAGDWVADLGRSTPIRTLSWDAREPGIDSTILADVEKIHADGLPIRHLAIVTSLFPEQPLGTWTSESLAALWQVNLTFPALVAQAVGPRLEAGGSVQFLLDTAIHRPWPKRLPYTAAKAGLASLVAGLAQALAPRVRVVGHALGTVLPDEASDPAFLAERSLLKQVGTPGDLLRAVRYAAESPFLTGEILTLDGGRRWI